MNRKKLIRFLNGRQLTFATLFQYFEWIKGYKLQSFLNTRNQIAVQVSDEIIFSDGTFDLMEKRPEVPDVLRWMLRTDHQGVFLQEEYESVLDVAASILLQVYQDKIILPDIDEMIFRRHKEGRNIHNLSWAYFRSGEIDALRLTAKHLLAEDRQEAQLACQLLHIALPNKMGETSDYAKRYDEYMRWIVINEPHLYFTNEHFQYSKQPAVCRIDLEEKYYGWRGAR